MSSSRSSSRQLLLFFLAWLGLWILMSGGVVANVYLVKYADRLLYARIVGCVFSVLAVVVSFICYCMTFISFQFWYRRKSYNQYIRNTLVCFSVFCLLGFIQACASSYTFEERSKMNGSNLMDDIGQWISSVTFFVLFSSFATSCFMISGWKEIFMNFTRTQTFYSQVFLWILNVMLFSGLVYGKPLLSMKGIPIVCSWWRHQLAVLCITMMIVMVYTRHLSLNHFLEHYKDSVMVNPWKHWVFLLIHLMTLLLVLSLVIYLIEEDIFQDMGIMTLFWNSLVYVVLHTLFHVRLWRVHRNLLYVYDQSVQDQQKRKTRTLTSDLDLEQV